MASYCRTRKKERTLFPPSSTSYETWYRGVQIANLHYEFDAYYPTTDTCSDCTHPGPPYKTGGPLYVSKYDRLREPITQPLTTVYDDGRRKYRMGFENLCATRVSVDNLPWGSTSSYDESTLTTLGTEGWRRCGVLSPYIDLNQTIAELREFKSLLKGAYSSLTKLFRKRTAYEVYSDISQGYLSWEFAIKPLIEDMLSLSKRHAWLEKRVKHIRRMNGKTRFCSRELRNEEDTWDWAGTTNSQCWTPVLSAYKYLLNDGADMPRSESVTRTRKVWIEGRFGFFYPVSKIVKWKERGMLDQEFGINLSAVGLLRTLYQVTPWTWLIDWATSTGDILANMVAIHNYGAYSKYAYVMATETWTFESSQTLTAYNSSFEHEVLGKFEQVFKHRLAASPFGFGVDMSGLSPWQISILVALGLSRG